MEPFKRVWCSWSNHENFYKDGGVNLRGQQELSIQQWPLLFLAIANERLVLVCSKQHLRKRILKENHFDFYQKQSWFKHRIQFSGTGSLRLPVEFSVHFIFSTTPKYTLRFDKYFKCISFLRKQLQSSFSLKTFKPCTVCQNYVYFILPHLPTANCPSADQRQNKQHICTSLHGANSGLNLHFA